MFRGVRHSGIRSDAVALIVNPIKVELRTVGFEAEVGRVQVCRASKATDDMKGALQSSSV